MEVIIILSKMFIVFVASLFFGLERQREHKPVSFGTFIFVAVGSCGLTIAAMNLHIDNYLPLLSAIVTGIGFLGAGAMIKQTDKIVGITTAAGIWVFAIFGILIGIEQFFIAAIIYVLIWITILYDKWQETKGIGFYQKKITIKTSKIIEEKEIENILQKGVRKHKMIEAEVDKKNDTMSIIFIIEGSRHEINTIPEMLYKKDWFSSFKIE